MTFLSVLTIVGAILVVMMLVAIAGLLKRIFVSADVSSHKQPQIGLAERVNWAAVVDDGVVVCKSGALMACWRYMGEDHGSASSEDVNAISRHLNNAVKRLGSGFMLHIDAVRQATPGYPEPQQNSFPDAVCRAIDEERRRLFSKLGTIYQSNFFVTLTWLPPSLKEEAAFKFLLEESDPSAPKKAPKELMHDALAAFNEHVSKFETNVTVTVKLQRLKAFDTVDDATERPTTYDRQLEYLNFCLTGTSHPVRLPPVPMYIDQIIGAEVQMGFVPVIGDKYIKCVTIDGYPSASYPGILAALAQLPMEYRWSTRFICLDQHQALKAVNRYRIMWQQKVYPTLYQWFKIGKPTVNEDAQTMVDDAGAMTTALESQEMAGGYYTATIVLMHQEYEPLEASAKMVVQLLQRLGFGARVETVNTMDAFMGTLPGHSIENVRSPPLSSANLADLIPTSTIWTGRETCPNPLYPAGSPPLCYTVTEGAAPFRLNLHVRDIGHTIMLGPTGNGKSVHLNVVMAQARRYEGMTIYAFDKGYSMLALAKAIWAATKGEDGLHFDIGKGDLNFSPLQELSTDADRAWACEWIETILALQDVKVSPGQRNGIASAIKTLHETSKGAAPTLSDFIVTVQERSIREALAPFVVGGTMGELLDAHEDGLRTGRFTVFEISELFNMGPRFALPVLLYLFRRIERALTGQPAMIVLDEAWLMLGHEVFRDKIREWLKTMRKNNVAVIIATQSLTDAANSGILDVIVESTATKIFLPNRFALDEENSKLYSRMGLSRRQMEILSTAIPKRQYFYTSEEGRRLYELAVGPLTLALAGVAGNEAAATIYKLTGQHGYGWLDVWLSARGLSLSAYSETEMVA